MLVKTTQKIILHGCAAILKRKLEESDLRPVVYEIPAASYKVGRKLTDFSITSLV